MLTFKQCGTRVSRWTYEVFDDGVDIATMETNFSELGGLDLYERRIDELGETTGNLCLTHTGGTNHQNVLGDDLALELALETRAAPACS